MDPAYKVVRQSEAIVRQVAPNKLVSNLITKEVSRDVSLATMQATNCHQKETTPYSRIYFVLDGELVLAIAKDIVVLQKGDACFLAKGTAYEMRGTFRVLTVNQPAFGA